MLLFTLAIYKYVLKTDNYKLTYDWFLHLVHKRHEGARCVSQDEWHN